MYTKKLKNVKGQVLRVASASVTFIQIVTIMAGFSYPQTVEAVNWNSSLWPYRAVLTVNHHKVKAVQSFTTTGTTNWTVPTGVTSVDVLVVGGGGGGGGGEATNGQGGGGGGGGGGGVVASTTYAVTPGASITVTVGTGGSGGAAGGASNAANGTAGGNSVFGTITAIGGGYGAGEQQAGGGGSGGSGGGSGGDTAVAGGTGTAGQGYNGGTGGSSRDGGGGGGGSAAGTDGNSGANGGDGYLSSITGTATYYGGGGGGGDGLGTQTSHPGGLGGGGTGGASAPGGTSYQTNNVGSGTANTGGGGGGQGAGRAGTGGAGGSGIVVVSYDSLSDFPVYVDLSDMPPTFWNYVRSDCGDIRVVASDGATELPREVVTCNTAAETGELWFKASSLSSETDTRFFIYYGYASGTDYGVTETYGANNVWTNGYVGVYHLQEGDSTAANFYKDSTANANHGTLTDADGDVAEKTVAKIEKGIDFSGDNEDNITATNLTTSDVVGGGITISGWVYSPNNPAGHTGYFGWRDDADEDLYILQLLGTNNIEARLRNSGGTDYTAANPTPVVTANQWNYVTLVLNGTNLQFYDNGLPEGSITVSGTMTSGSTPFVMGVTNGQADNTDQDEIRASNTARSAGWIQTEYNNQYSPSSFYTISSGSDTSLSRTMRLFEGYKVKMYTSFQSNTVSDYVESFTSTGTTTWSVPAGVNSVSVLVVAGGGAGGAGTGGGGGGGGVVYNSSYSVTPGDGISVVVGAGGSGVTSNNGQNGGNSAFGSLTAIGGGGGGAGSGVGGSTSGLSGGSGGGAISSGTAGSGTTGQGNNGGVSTNWSGYYGAGAGGGAGAVGGNGTNLAGGNGGAGIANSITGATVYYGGGGGGGTYNGGTNGAGGIGGGGNGGSNAAGAPTAGESNTGGGGGGQRNNLTTAGGNGGSGIVIISYDRQVPVPTIILYPNY